MRADWNQLSEWFAGYRLGDGAAANSLFTGLTGALHGYFAVRVPSPSDAADLLQATLLKIHFARDRFDAAQSLKTWVFTIASRTLVDHWRELSKDRDRREMDSTSEEGEFDATIDSLPSPLIDPALKAELSGDITAALESLKPMDRSIVYLSALEGLSVSEIASVHGLSEGAAKVRAHRAFKALRKVLDPS